MIDTDIDIIAIDIHIIHTYCIDIDIDVDIIDIDVDTLKVGYSWIDHLKLEADKLVTDLQMKFAESRQASRLDNARLTINIDILNNI